MPNCNNCGALLSPETKRACWRCGHPSAGRRAGASKPFGMQAIYVASISSLVLGVGGWLGLSRWWHGAEELEHAVPESPSTPEPTQVNSRALQPDPPAPEPPANALGTEAPDTATGDHGRAHDTAGEAPAKSKTAKASRAARASSGKGGAMNVSFGSISVSGRLPSSTLMEAVRERKSKIELCYRPGQGNDIVVRFIVGRDGRVSNVSHVTNTLPSSAASCVISSFYGMTFPMPESGIVVATVPVKFSPR